MSAETKPAGHVACIGPVVNAVSRYIEKQLKHNQQAGSKKGSCLCCMAYINQSNAA